LWDFSDESTLEEIQSKSSQMQAEVEGICQNYFQATEVEKKQMEKELEEESIRAAAERAANGSFLIVN
jgi:hypothetical protein